MKYKLIGVEGEDVSEFSDLIGKTGPLRASGKVLNFVDGLALYVKRKVTKDGKLKVFTTLGNCFTFREVSEPTKV